MRHVSLCNACWAEGEHGTLAKIGAFKATLRLQEIPTTVASSFCLGGGPSKQKGPSRPPTKNGAFSTKLRTEPLWREVVLADHS